MFDEELGGRILPFEAAAAARYAEIVVDRRRVGAPIEAFDALIAALVARAAAVGLVELISENDRVAATREGWIAVPREGSLSLLAPG